jgi:hypothetical protein
MGYPEISDYKYLGGVISRDLKVKDHLNYIDRKFNFLMGALTSVRMMKDLRLSVNLFRTLFMPLVRMGLMNAMVTSKTDYNLYEKRIRARFKQFCLLPKCLPNKMVRVMLGNLFDIGGHMCAQSIMNLKKDGLYKGADG